MSDDWDNEPVVMPTLIKQPAAPAADGWSDDETPVPASRSFAEKPSVDNSNGFGFDSNNNDEESTEMVEVEPGKVGKVIGPKGAVINELQSEYGVKIDIEKEDNMNGKREVKVTGPRGSVMKVIEQIKAKTSDGSRRENTSNGHQSYGGGHSETLEVDPFKVGRIVGKQGSTIQQLQNDFSVKIDITKEDNQNCKRDVQVSGSEGDVMRAVENIKSLVEGGFSGGQDGSRPQRDNNTGADGDKPREVYIPQEPTDDEAVLFDNSIKAGVNFKNFENIEVKLSGDDRSDIKPINTFEEAIPKFRQIVLENIAKAGYDRPTPVQKFAIPVMMAGRDLMACAQTGSGKTAAFLLPIINTFLESGESADGGSIRALIVTPTRELAIQIFDEARKFALRSWIKTAIAYGGVQTGYQIQKIQQGCHILVATPGRLCDLVNKGVVNYSALQYLVLDEADRMLDMGFKTKIEEISNHDSYNKQTVQTVMFSATFPEDIQQLAAGFLKNHMFLTVGIVGSASTDVTQTVQEVPSKQKRSTLFNWLKTTLAQDPNKRILVFTETKKTTDFLASFMTEMKISSTCIHGARFQREREMALNEFRQGKRKVLIATSVAARGLDIKDVTDVVNYDLPKTIDDYVHRIGRTGRVGNVGSALSFYDPERDSDIRAALVGILSQSKQTIPDFLGSGGSYQGENKFGGKDIRVAAGAVQEDDEWN